jgi:hypothetical protein
MGKETNIAKVIYADKDDGWLPAGKSVSKTKIITGSFAPIVTLYDKIAKIIFDQYIGNKFKYDSRQNCWYGMQAAMQTGKIDIFVLIYGTLCDEIKHAPHNEKQYLQQMVDEFLGRGYREAIEYGHLSIIKKLSDLGFDMSYHNDAILRCGLDHKNYNIISYALSIGIVPTISNFIAVYYNIGANIDFYPNLVSYFKKDELFDICQDAIKKLNECEGPLRLILSHRFDDMSINNICGLMFLILSISPQWLINLFFGYINYRTKFVFASGVCLANRDKYMHCHQQFHHRLPKSDDTRRQNLKEQLDQLILIKKRFWQHTVFTLGAIYKPRSLRTQMTLFD